jgi:hypothetical protein
MSLQEEPEFLAPFLESAAGGGVLVVGQIKPALTSSYNLLRRHHWRKLAPNKRHPQSDPSASGAMPKVRYRGLAKNANCVFAMLALINMEQTAQCIGAFRMRQRP